MNVQFNNRPVEILNLVFTSDVVDCYIEKAEYTDTEIMLTDAELDQLQKDVADYIYDQWFERQIDRAEAMSEGER